MTQNLVNPRPFERFDKHKHIAPQDRAELCGYLLTQTSIAHNSAKKFQKKDKR
jgi:hypothetical protein